MKEEISNSYNDKTTNNSKNMDNSNCQKHNFDKDEKSLVKILNLRPHHVVCFKFFVGKGYNEEFIHHTAQTIEILRQNPKMQVKIVNSDDYLCQKCPNLFEINQNKECRSTQKVHLLDELWKKEMQIDFDSTYTWEELNDRINNKLNKQVLQANCSSCNWFDLCQSLLK